MVLTWLRREEVESTCGRFGRGPRSRMMPISHGVSEAPGDESSSGCILKQARVAFHQLRHEKLAQLQA